MPDHCPNCGSSTLVSYEVFEENQYLFGYKCLNCSFVEEKEEN